MDRLKRIQNLLRHNEKGIALPVILMVIGGLALAGAAAIGIAMGEIGISRNDAGYKAAFHTAEAGISDALDGIQGNGALLPRPMGDVPVNNYRFNVAIGKTERYDVTVSLPIVTTVTMGGDSDIITPGYQILVADATGLSIGDTVVVGDGISSRMMAVIQNIRYNVVGSYDELTLVRSSGTPFDKPVTTNMAVARNLIRITSVGEHGNNLTGTYTPTSWRVAANALSDTTTPPAGGRIDSTTTIQAEFSPYEMLILDSFDAVVNPHPSHNNTLKGPMLVLNSAIIQPYNQGDFTGPIFAVGSAVVQFRDAGGVPLSYPTAPKVIRIPPLAITSAQQIVDSAASQAACYQQACSISAPAQIYYVNGYDIRVWGANAGVDNPTNTNNKLQINSISPSSIVTAPAAVTLNITLKKPPGGKIFRFYMYNGGTPGVPLEILAFGGSTANLTIVPGPGGSVTTNVANLTNTFTVTVRIPPGAVSDNIAAHESTTNKWSNGKFLNIGNAMVINSSERQVRADITAADILTTALPTTVVNFTGMPTDTLNSDGHAVLFNGKKINTFSQSDMGMQSVYYTRYFIRTDGPGCTPVNMTIVSKTIVTYMGTRKDFCNPANTKHLFQFETIWNHNPDNTQNTGLQADDADPAIAGIPHKGYYKWVRAKDSTENEPLKPESLLGDREFNSVFNHSAQYNADGFHYAIVNWNINKVRMIGWSNPPLVYESSTQAMVVKPDPFPVFPAASWLDSTSSNKGGLDNDDISGNFSSFPKTGAADGFDFSNITPTYYQDAAGVSYAIDASTVAPGGGPNVKLYKSSALPLFTFDKNITTGSPLMQNTGYSLSVPPTVITATNSGPLTTFEIKRGTANLLFDAANGIPFNVKALKVETKNTGGAQILIGTEANPALVVAGEVEVESENCGGFIGFGLTGKLISKEVEFEHNVTYNMNTNVSTANDCLTSGVNYIFLRKQSWKEIRN